jgi:hypothetical protein
MVESAVKTFCKKVVIYISENPPSGSGIVLEVC